MSRKGIVVKCPNCGHEEELNDLAAWFFIILKDTKCEKCETTITHDDMVNEDE